jgi:uncharacterized protein
MKFAILFEDDPAHADKRQQHMGEHLAFLERNAARILAAGPLRNAEDGAPAGGLWLVDADSHQEARRLTEQDPLFATGLRRTVTVLEWRRVFADGNRFSG